MEFIPYIKKYRYHIIITINFLWVWALLSPNIYYMDDGYRAAGGFYNWGGDFRPFADWLYYLLGMGSRFTDLTPLPQLISLIFLYSIFFLFLKENFINKKLFVALLIFLPLVWNPFLLSNLYFRYDSIFMISSVFLSVVAVSFVNNGKIFKSFILLYISCGFYQPAIVAYVCTSLFFIYKLNEDSEVLRVWLKQTILYFSVFMVAILAYYFTIMKLTTSYNFYSSTHSEMSVINIIPNISSSIDELSIVFSGDSGFVFFFIFLYMLLINFLLMVKRHAYLGVVFFIIINFTFILCAAGVNLMLDVPRFEYRTLIFFGFYVSYLLVGCYFYFYENDYVFVVTFLALLINFYFISIALNVSNAQKVQSDFEELLIFEIANSIYDLDINKNNVFIFSGETFPSNIDVLMDKYPIIRKTVINQVHFSFKIKKYYPIGLKTFTFNSFYKESNFIINNKKYLKLLKSSKFYNIYEVSGQNKVLIHLNEVD